ncbi:type IV secretory system conjugative DNA transfer family protein [Nocardia sp. NPDC058176]|uniref:type IV secretory system conjugative DNA transfer family protein n=1 Tax=Nocardia sp. NPDC058176 TaxID=3346368 RepID=UPI0036DCBD8C
MVLSLVVGVVSSAALRIAGGQDVPGNPFQVVLELITGRLRWSGGATVATIGMLLVVVATSVAIVRPLLARRGHRTRVDDIAKYMGTLRDVESLTEAGCTGIARKLGVRLGEGGAPGIPLGTHIPSGAPLYASYEDVIVDIWGPRTGKTTSRVIPAILSAIGPVLATSNKRDVVDATRWVREQQTGVPVRIFDPQNITGEKPTWYWNPLSKISNEVNSAALAARFADGQDGRAAKADAFFEPEGQDLLGGLFLAAAIGKRPITIVYEWASDYNDKTSIKILQNHGGFPQVAKGLISQYNAAEKQKSGVFATARKMAVCLKMTHIQAWVTDDGTDREHFDVDAFVRSRGTLYPMSREGEGSASPIIAALVESVTNAAVDYASTQPGGRLAVPLLAALDEAANVVPWRDLPKLYSHFGSRGINVMTVLQSWSQGVEVWGPDGMRKLFSAANVKGYGGGVALDDGEFLTNLSSAIGEHWALQTSVSLGSHTSANRSVVERRMLKEADLEALPRGRAIIRSSGNRPVLIKPAPWYEGPFADAVNASIRKSEQRTAELIAAASVTLEKGEAA